MLSQLSLREDRSQFELPCPLSGFPGSSVVKNAPTNAGVEVQSLGWENPPEKEMATHFSILVWGIPWRKEPGKSQT